MRIRSPAAPAEGMIGVIELCMQWTRPIQMFELPVPREGITVEEAKTITARRLGIHEALSREMQARRIA